MTSGETNVKFRRTLKRRVFSSIYPTPSEEQLVQKEKQFRAAKSRGISIPKIARPSLASIKKDKSGERKIKRKHVLDKPALSKVTTYCGMIDTHVFICITDQVLHLFNLVIKLTLICGLWVVVGPSSYHILLFKLQNSV